MPEPTWLDEARDVTDEPDWTADAVEVKEPVIKGPPTAAMRARSGLPVFEGERDPSLPREELAEDFAARDRVEGGMARGRVLELGTSEISVDPRTGDSEFRMAAPEDAREAVLYETAADVRARTPGISTAADDTVSLRDYSPFRAGASIAEEQSMPGLASAMRYVEGLQPDVRYSPGAMAQGASEMLTFGHTDEIAGAIGDRPYEEGRDLAREQMAERAAENPGSTLAGMGAGMGLLAALPGAREVAASRGAGALGRVGAAMGEGTVMGALAGAGTSEGDVGTRQFAGDVAEGGVIGGAAGGVFQGAGEAGGAAVRRFAGDADELLEDASMLRIRGMFGGEGPPRRTLRETFGSRRGRGERVRSLVTEFRDLGVRNADDAPRVHESAGEALDDIATRIDDAAARAPQGMREGTSPHTVDADAIAQRIRAHAQQLRAQRGVDDAVVDAMEREAQRWEQAAAQEPMTFRRAWQFRQEMGRPQYWTVGPRGEMNPAQQFRRDLYSIVREELDTAAERAGPELAQAWRQNNRAYSILSPFVEAAEEARFRGVHNRQISPTDYLGAMAAYTQGGIGGAVAGGIGNRLVRGYEHTVKASAMERLADVVRRQPGQLGPYGTVLQNAMNRGPGVFSATWFVLSQQHPELQQRVQELDDPEAAETAEEY